MNEVNDTKTNKTKEEILIEEKIKSGEEIEVTKAVEILSLLKSNISETEISNKTQIPISKIKEIKKLFNIK